MESRTTHILTIVAIIVFIAIIASLILLPGLIYADKPSEGAPETRDTAYQISTIDALLQSVYDGFVPISEVRKHGDTAIGTIDALDGELIAVDGEYYTIRSDGVAYPLEDTTTTPFIVTTFFDPDLTIHTDKTENISQFEDQLEAGLPSANMFYAIRIDGTFDYVKTRSVPKQTRPYPKLAEVIKEQSEFEFYNTTGTIVGFWSPEFVSGLNVPGYHIHFLTADRTRGGHVLDLQMTNEDMKLDITPDFFMVLPTEGDFYQVDLTEDLGSALETVEKN
ncbi:acetolactate decarboxylase [Methanogenium marinum]|uniref:Alpha-acetolactate decarboxylase n=1 Tax=Methanogenium marinum TaxID=348610 RepID=A0A9Q4KS71_9EURY|nr:acetolactate decarboxylase [Methanogenium marinum]MDE4907654.1 acetolactate decarboxylase [Methanogenium marinum]